MCRKTAVGLFEHPGVVDQVVLDLGARTFHRDKIRIAGEPREMEGGCSDEARAKMHLQNRRADF